MVGGMGRLPGRDVKRDLAMHVYICYLSRYMEIILSGRFSSRPAKRDPVRSTRIPSKVGQSLSDKHFVPLCREDAMLT